MLRLGRSAPALRLLAERLLAFADAACATARSCCCRHTAHEDPAAQPAALAPTAPIDSDHPAVIAFAREHAVGADDRERAVALTYAVRDGARPLPHRPERRGHARQQRARARLRLVRAQAALLAAAARPPASRRAWLCRRAQPPQHRAAAPHGADRPVRLARLHRPVDRRPLGQGDAGLQPRCANASACCRWISTAAPTRSTTLRQGRQTATWSTSTSTAPSTTCRWIASSPTSRIRYPLWLHAARPR